MSIATRIQSMEEHISDAYDSLSKFGVAAPSNKNIENIASLVNEIYDNTPKTDYVSGTDLTLENTRIGKIDFKDTDNIEKIGLGATSQYTATGKNKLSLTIENKTTGGITLIKNNDNSYKISGTSTSLVLFNSSNTQTLTANTTYTLGITNGNNNVQLSLRTSDGYTQYVKTEGTATYATFTPTTDIEVKLFVRIPSGATVNETIFPMVVEGSAIGTYEPYVGGKASPNPDFPQDINVVKGNQNIVIKGKNLLNLTDGTYTNNGIEAVVRDGVITLNGTAGTNNSYINIPYSQTIEPKIEYTLSLNNDFTTSNTSDGLRLSTNDDTRGSFTALNRTKTFTFQNALASNQITLRLMAGSTVNNGTLMPQLEEGNTATSYIPHQESNYEISLSGKNLLNNTKSTTILNGLTFTINEDKSVTITGTATSQTDFYLVGASSIYDNIGLNAGTYNLSGCINGSSSTYMLIAVRKNSSGTTAIYPVSTSSDGIAMTVENDYTFRIFIRVTNGTSMNTTIYPQLEKGSTATSYAPYFNIELYKTENYQDYIYKNNNNWYLHKEIGKKIVDKDTSITGYTTNVSGYYRYGINISDIKILTDGRAIPDLYCSHYKGQMVGNDGSWGAHQGIAIDNTHQRVYINDNTYYTEDATAYKTWIANNNLTIYYPLATSTDTQITDTTLISQLDAWYNAQSMDDITYITVDGNLPIQLKLKALKK